jgi:thymidylate synthase ThyX
MSFITVKSIAASICEHSGARIDTLQLRYPRMVHADFMTHRVFSRNASSSRAIPHASLTVRDADIYVPRFRKNKPGMQPGAFLSTDEQEKAERIWRDMAEYVLNATRELSDKSGLNVHKQWVNRPLEWFGYIEVLVTSTEWSNFDALRDHSDAQDEIEALAKEMKRVRDRAAPTLLKPGQWHLPYVQEEDVEHVTRLLRSDAIPEDVACVSAALRKLLALDVSPRDAILLAVSAARCCRVSYSKHDGARPSLSDDMRRYLQLAGSDPKHASPLEHQARPIFGLLDEQFQGNFRGFTQFRKYLPNENL